MREIRPSGLMSGEGKRASRRTAPLLDSTAFVVKYNGLHGTAGVWVKYGIFYHEGTKHTKFAVPYQQGKG